MAGVKRIIFKWACNWENECVFCRVELLSSWTNPITPDDEQTGAAFDEPSKRLGWKIKTVHTEK